MEYTSPLYLLLHLPRPRTGPIILRSTFLSKASKRSASRAVNSRVSEPYVTLLLLAFHGQLLCVPSVTEFVYFTLIRETRRH